jgi:hypothetical protein
MMPSSSTRLARDIRSHIPSRADVTGYLVLDAGDAAIWDAAVPYLRVRNNDRHTLYAYGIARALLSRIPGADPRVVLPAILLHDTGWSTVPEEQVLEAIAPGGGRPELVRQHETEGAHIATQLLSELGVDPATVERVTRIIDGHDTRHESESLEDSIVKDSDKLWRLTPDGLDVVCGWFALTPDEALRLCCARVHESLFTEPARAMAGGFAAIASMDLTGQRAAIG